MVERALTLTVLSVSMLLGGTSVTSAASSPERKERIEQLWLDVAGTSGRIETTPVYMDDAAATYHFGARFCGRSHRLGEQTLQALQGALASSQPVRIDAEAFTSGKTTRQCVTGVAFFAPVR